jgi:hypothetical protein
VRLSVTEGDIVAEHGVGARSLNNNELTVWPDFANPKLNPLRRVAPPHQNVSIPVLRVIALERPGAHDLVRCADNGTTHEGEMEPTMTLVQQECIVAASAPAPNGE